MRRIKSFASSDFHFEFVAVTVRTSFSRFASLNHGCAWTASRSLLLRAQPFRFKGCVVRRAMISEMKPVAAAASATGFNVAGQNRSEVFVRSQKARSLSRQVLQFSCC